MKNSEIHLRDPFVVYLEGIYYLYGSRAASFGRKTGGFDVYESTDLENWSAPKEVFHSETYGLNRDANWAPEVHFWRGSFYMFATFTRESGLRGTFILRSDSPEGPFVPLTGEAYTPKAWECLDGTFFAENGVPYSAFCHEHTQILDGTICCTALSFDLTRTVGEVHELFKASSFLGRKATEEAHCVTDGPFLYRHSDGRLFLLWSTVAEGYVQCLAVSDNGSLFGTFRHLPPLFSENGGHGMIFRGKNGLYLALHCPNTSGKERPVFLPIVETADGLALQKI